MQRRVTAVLISASRTPLWLVQDGEGSVLPGVSRRKEQLTAAALSGAADRRNESPSARNQNADQPVDKSPGKRAHQQLYSATRSLDLSLPTREKRWRSQTARQSFLSKPL